MEQNNDKAAQYIAEAAETVAARFVESFEWMAERCESPIERLLLAGLTASVDISGMSDVEFSRGEYTFGQQRPNPFQKADIYMQSNVGPYRVDFLIDDGIEPEHRHFIIIECDGHDFHERTKEQARRDKARDRYFATLGLKVLRFTGSELFADCEKCANEVLDHITYQRFGPFGENDHRKRG